MTKLTAVKVRTATHPGGKVTRPIRIGDGGGLYLQIAQGGTKSWLLRYTLQGKAREMGLGPADADGSAGHSLKEARELAAAAHVQLGKGIDPIDAREALRSQQQTAAQEAKARTFKAAALACIESKRAGWSNAKHSTQWKSTLEKHVFPHIGERDVAEVSVDEVLAILKPIWEAIPETASRVRQRIETVLDYAAAPSRRWRSTENPARWKGSLEHELPLASKVKRVKHHPSLPWQQLPAFWKALAGHNGLGALATKFAILTACRSNEVRKARWNEIDLERGIFTIPADRMKNRLLHQVPLSGPAMQLLKDLQPFAGGSPDALVLASRVTRGGQAKPLSDMTLSELVRGMSKDRLAPGELPRWRDDENRAVVVHGFRTTFKAWSLSKGYPDHLSEKALAHVDKSKTRGAYARDQLLEERRPMMDAWAAYCLT